MINCDIHCISDFQTYDIFIRQTKDELREEINHEANRKGVKPIIRGPGIPKQKIDRFVF